MALFLPFLAGLLGGSSGIDAEVSPFSRNEIATKKTLITNTTTSSVTNTENFTDARTFSYIINSPNASQSTKKELATTQTPVITLEPTITPSIAGSGASGGGTLQGDVASGLNLEKMALYGALGFGAYLLLTRKK